MTDPKPDGLAAWLPATASEDSFFGLAHGTHLSAGVVYEGKEQTRESLTAAIMGAINRMREDNGAPWTVVVHPSSWIARMADPTSKLNRKHRRRQAKMRLKNRGKAWV